MSQRDTTPIDEQRDTTPLRLSQRDTAPLPADSSTSEVEDAGSAETPSAEAPRNEWHDDDDLDTAPIVPPPSFPTNDDSIPQIILVNDQEIVLPAGISVAQWALERVRDQNPRIRAFLGCNRLLGEVLESNYAILHCSPERLVEIWRRVRRIADVLRNEVKPLLANTSAIPALEDARVRADEALRMLDRGVLRNLDRFPEILSKDQVQPVRKLLCVSLGKISAFLQNAFGDLVANDPRSLHDADYFLSRRFPQDIEEAEWLFAAVSKLKGFLTGLESQRVALLQPFAEHLRRRRTLPEPGLWEPAETFFDKVRQELVPRLKEILALRGIRFNEMEILDRYAIEIPTLCRMVGEVQVAGHEALAILADAEPGARAILHRAFAQHILARIGDIDAHLRDLVAFVPLWIRGLEQRRALLLHRPVKRPSRRDGLTRPRAETRTRTVAADSR